MEIRNYTLNFGSGRPLALTCAQRRLASAEIELRCLVARCPREHMFG